MKVKVDDSPFEDFDGLVEEVDDVNQSVKVAVSIFGRETPVELEFTYDQADLISATTLRTEPSFVDTDQRSALGQAAELEHGAIGFTARG